MEARKDYKRKIYGVFHIECISAPLPVYASLLGDASRHFLHLTASLPALCHVPSNCEHFSPSCFGRGWSVRGCLWRKVERAVTEVLRSCCMSVGRSGNCVPGENLKRQRISSHFSSTVSSTAPRWPHHHYHSGPPHHRSERLRLFHRQLALCLRFPRFAVRREEGVDSLGAQLAPWRGTCS